MADRREADDLLRAVTYIYNSYIQYFHKIEAFAGHYFGIEMRLKLLMSFAYDYDYPIEICVACTVETRNDTCLNLGLICDLGLNSYLN